MDLDRIVARLTAQVAPKIDEALARQSHSLSTVREPVFNQPKVKPLPLPKMTFNRRESKQTVAKLRILSSDRQPVLNQQKAKPLPLPKMTF